MTKGLCSRLNEYAKTLTEGKILARLSAGDAIAQELKYHCHSTHVRKSPELGR